MKKFKDRTLRAIAELICGDKGPGFTYRSSSYLTEFFQDCETDYIHDGSTRWRWVAGVLEELLEQPQTNPHAPPDDFLRVIRVLMDPADATNDDPGREKALELLNKALSVENLEAFYGEDRQCYIRNLLTKTPMIAANPHRPFTPKEVERRGHLADFLTKASEDQIIEDVLLPLFRQLGFHRVTASGHKDKSHEFGKDVWMRFVLPTQHVLYFGLQAKKGKLDAAGMSKGSNANIAEVHQQVLMMLGHEIFDPETSRKVLVDHGIIVAGGEITKAARSWIGAKLDATKRSQILFMDRDDILDLYISASLPLPAKALPSPPPQQEGLDDIPF